MLPASLIGDTTRRRPLKKFYNLRPDQSPFCSSTYESGLFRGWQITGSRVVVRLYAFGRRKRGLFQMYGDWNCCPGGRLRRVVAADSVAVRCCPTISLGSSLTRHFLASSGLFQASERATRRARSSPSLLGCPRLRSQCPLTK